MREPRAVLPPPDIPGLHAVRVLARDERHEDVLVRGDPDGGVAVLRRAVDASASRELLREARVREHLTDTGVAAVVDAVRDLHGPALLLPFLAGPSLSRALAEERPWNAGEAVFVLGRLAQLIGRAHRCGVAFGGVSASGVLLHDAGPVVDAATTVELPIEAPEAVLCAIPEVGADREAVRAIAGEVLGRVTGARARAAVQLAAELAACAPPDVIAHLEAGCEALASPTPLRAEAEVLRERPATAPASEAAPDAAESVRTAGPLASAAQRLRDRVVAVQGLLDRLPPTRRRVVVAGASAIVAAALLLALVPPPAEPAGIAVAEAVPASPTPSAPQDDPRAADDPAVAVPALLRMRDECFHDLSILCLEGVDQAGSAALADDRARITAGDVPEPRGDIGGVRVVERLGGSALVEIGPETAPASLLVVRSEAGWRIRDWVAGSD